MERGIILKILREFGIDDYKEKIEIDSSRDNDYRLNIILDKKYVLRINTNRIDEARLDEIERLVNRYLKLNILAPKLYKNKDNKYSIKYNNYSCYLSEYLDYDTLDKVNNIDYDLIDYEINKSIGLFSKEYTNIDLIETKSSWSIIDLAPLDDKIDEKQENLNVLLEKLKELGEFDLVKDIINFNAKTRDRLKKIYKSLPRTVIQGDINDTNILVKDGHFIGLIDFNLSGTEVNVNNFCCETNECIMESDFNNLDPKTIYNNKVLKQEASINVILSEYKLNDLEKIAIKDYRRICEISMYPNVMSYIEYLKKDKAKMLEIIKIIINS